MLQQLSNKNWVWQLSNNVRGNFSSETIAKLTKWKQTCIFSREAGGLLLGFIDIETNGLLVESITTPCWGDKRSRYGFYRGTGHQKQANKWHQDTEQHGTIVGLWHTHPEPVPHPSSTDWEDLNNMLKNATYCGSGLVYIIVGTEKIRLWFGYKHCAIDYIGYIPI